MTEYQAICPGIQLLWIVVACRILMNVRLLEVEDRTCIAGGRNLHNGLGESLADGYGGSFCDLCVIAATVAKEGIGLCHCTQ